MTQKNNWSRQDYLLIRFRSIEPRSYFAWFLYPLLLLLLNGCSSHLSPTPAEKIKFYESRARHYQTLSDLQRLSPPYASFNHKQQITRLNNDHLRMVYLNEARRYRKLAQDIRVKTTSESNETKE